MVRMRNTMLFALVLCAVLGTPCFAPQAFAQNACGAAQFCAETDDFVATVSSFRVTSDAYKRKVIDITVHFQNKLTVPVSLGYVNQSGVISDDRGNRSVPYGARAYSGIGLVAGASFDGKFTLRPGGSADAQFEYWQQGYPQIVGFTHTLDFTVAKIHNLEGNQHTLGGQSPLHFQGLKNGSSQAAVNVVPHAPRGYQNAQGGTGAPGGYGGRNRGNQPAPTPGQTQTAQAQPYPQQQSPYPQQAQGQGYPQQQQPQYQQANAPAPGTGDPSQQQPVDPNAAQTDPGAAINSVASSTGNAKVMAGAGQVANTASTLSTLGGLFKKKKNQQQDAQQQQQAPPQNAAPQGQEQYGSAPPQQAGYAQQPGMMASANVPPPPRNGVSVPQPTSTMSNYGDMTQPSTTAKIAASAGFLDVIGIKLGMPSKDAMAILRKTDPTFKFTATSFKLEGFTQDLTSQVHASMPQDQKMSQFFTLGLTTAPTQPVVWSVVRQIRFANDVPTYQNVLTGLRNKYGPESVTPPPGSTASTFYWYFDANGNRIGQMNCAVVGSDNAAEFIRGGAEKYTIATCPGVSIVMATIGTDGPAAPNSLTQSLDLMVQNPTLLLSSVQATRAVAVRAQKARNAKTIDDANKRGVPSF